MLIESVIQLTSQKDLAASFRKSILAGLQSLLLPPAIPSFCQPLALILSSMYCFYPCGQTSLTFWIVEESTGCTKPVSFAGNLKSLVQFFAKLYTPSGVVTCYKQLSTYKTRFFGWARGAMCEALKASHSSQWHPSMLLVKYKRTPQWQNRARCELDKNEAYSSKHA